MKRKTRVLTQISFFCYFFLIFFNAYNFMYIKNNIMYKSPISRGVDKFHYYQYTNIKNKYHIFK